MPVHINGVLMDAGFHHRGGGIDSRPPLSPLLNGAYTTRAESRPSSLSPLMMHRTSSLEMLNNIKEA